MNNINANRKVTRDILEISEESSLPFPAISNLKQLCVRFMVDSRESLLKRDSFTDVFFFGYSTHDSQPHILFR